MSEESNVSSELVEKDTKVVITPDDVKAALDFWTHFDIPIAPSLQSAVDAFAADPTFPNQERIKLEVCKAISETDHAAFKDEMFVRIAEECAGVTFEMTFDRDFENTVTEKQQEA